MKKIIDAIKSFFASIFSKDGAAKKKKKDGNEPPDSIYPLW